MAAGAIPHFHNSAGLGKIEVGSHTFMCMGALPPHDHPHVFLTMGAGHDVICPYCSTHYAYNAALQEGTSLPPSARYHEEAA